MPVTLNASLNLIEGGNNLVKVRMFSFRPTLDFSNVLSSISSDFFFTFLFCVNPTVRFFFFFYFIFVVWEVKNLLGNLITLYAVLSHWFIFLLRARVCYLFPQLVPRELCRINIMNDIWNVLLTNRVVEVSSNHTFHFDFHRICRVLNKYRWWQFLKNARVRFISK